MNLYIVDRVDQIGWDEYDRYLVQAISPDEAKKDLSWGTEVDEINIVVTYVGIASSDLGVEKVLMSSFNAG